MEALTQFETDILQKFANGQILSRIADDLGLGLKEMEERCQIIRRKTGIYRLENVDACESVLKGFIAPTVLPDEPETPA